MRKELETAPKTGEPSPVVGPRNRRRRTVEPGRGRSVVPFWKRRFAGVVAEESLVPGGMKAL